MAAVPLRSKEQLLGLLTVVSQEHLELAPEQVSLLEAIGYQLSLAVENSRLYEQLKESETRKTSLLHELEKSLRELQEAQTKLVQSEKLAAIGQLVSGITSIIGYAQLLRSADVDSEVRSDLNRIVEQAQRSARIVQNLLTFSRQYKPERRLVDVNQLIQDTLELVNYQLTVNQITVDLQLSESVPAILADPHQLQQVWLNLIQNAHQAMSDSSRPRVLRIHSFVTDANQVGVEFSDNGPGIAPNALEKLFDPFFTTKPVGKGTGLGLSICYGIVQEHNGQIMAENNAEGGATFVVELPIQEAGAHAQQAAELPLTVSSGQGKVLLVDDEPNILELVDRFLSRQGYEVETIDDGNQAAKQIINGDYDVIVLDMVMPQMGGIEICQQVIKERPEYEARIIFASGDLITDEVRDFLKRSESRYIAKPFELSELIQVIQEVTGQLD
jgi:two-component system NtrC family sensor kinase